MKDIKGVTFGFSVTPKDSWSVIQESFNTMITSTACNTVVLPVVGMQKTAFSEKISYDTPYTIGDKKLVQLIEYAKSHNLRIFLKPMVQCEDGTWRAHINFFDQDVPGEPCWTNWFQSYNKFLLHYAKIAEKTNCEMLIIGCEMVQAQRRDTQWRALIKKIREVYNGLITYNTDKYQEENVTWWDAVDVISSSGYYPISDWIQELERIKKVVEKQQKPFFFAEAGCMSTKGSSKRPNNWNLEGDVSLEEQAEFFRTMFKFCENPEYDFVKGMVIWDWPINLYSKEEASKDKGYNIYGKPACDVIYNKWSQ